MSPNSLLSILWSAQPSLLISPFIAFSHSYLSMLSLLLGTTSLFLQASGLCIPALRLSKGDPLNNSLFWGSSAQLVHYDSELYYLI